MRGRQTVTKINSDNTAVAAESIYDYNGRKAIDILPVPLQSPALTYNANLNVNTTGNKYSWADFDVDQTSCNPSVGSLKTQLVQVNITAHQTPIQPETTRTFQMRRGIPLVKLNIRQIIQAALGDKVV